MGIIVCDIDGLKLINDTLGHETGDTVLKSTARILLKTVGTDDIVTRIGGDEFVIILPDCSPGYPQQVCSNIKNCMAEYNQKSAHLELNVSLGYAYTKNSSKINKLQSMMKK